MKVGISTLSEDEQDDRREGRRRRARRTHGLLWGLTLMAVGIAFFLSRNDLLDIGPAWKLWPVVLIVLGAADLLEPHERPVESGVTVLLPGRGQMIAPQRRKVGSGLTLILLGFVFLATNYNFQGLTLATAWPLILVAVGIGQVGRALFESAEGRRRGPNGGDAPSGGPLVGPGLPGEGAGHE